MNEKDPSNIQMTTVGFGPSQTEDAIGTVMPASRPEAQFSVFWPFLIVLLTMIFSTTRDIMALNKRMEAINNDNAPALQLLEKSTKQTEFIESLRTGLEKISPSDPVAAQISAEFFPPPPAPKPDGQNDAATPAK